MLPNGEKVDYGEQLVYTGVWPQHNTQADTVDVALLGKRVSTFLTYSNLHVALISIGSVAQLHFCAKAMRLPPSLHVPWAAACTWIRSADLIKDLGL